MKIYLCTFEINNKINTESICLAKGNCDACKIY